MPFSINIRENRCIMTRTQPDDGDTVLTTVIDSGPVSIDVNDITRFDITYEEPSVGHDGRLRFFSCSFSAGAWKEGVQRRYHVHLRGSPVPRRLRPNPDDPLLQYLQHVYFDLHQQGS